MNQLVDLASNKELTMSSLEISELTGKAHFHVCRDIRKMLSDLYQMGDDTNRDHPSGVSETKDNRGYTACFNLDYTHTVTLVAGYNAKLRIAIIKRWKELEEQAKKATVQLPDFTNPAVSARAWAEQYEAKLIALEEKAQAVSEKEKALEKVEELEEELVEALPSVEYVRNFVDAHTGDFTFRQVAKCFKANESDLREFLIAKGIMYRLNGKLAPVAHHVHAGRFILLPGVTEGGKAFTQVKFTPKGFKWLYDRWSKQFSVKPAV